MDIKDRHKKVQVTNYFDLVDVSTWLWSKKDQYRLWGSFKFATYKYICNCGNSCIEHMT